MNKHELEREAHTFARHAAQDLCMEGYMPALLLGIHKNGSASYVSAIVSECHFTDEEIEAAVRNLLATIVTKGNPCHVKKV